MKSILITLLNIITYLVIYSIVTITFLIVNSVIYDNLPHYNILIILDVIGIFVVSWFASTFATKATYIFLECLGYEKYTFTYAHNELKEYFKWTNTLIQILI